MIPKKPTRTTKCTTCNNKLGSLKAINCQLCVQWVCLPCSTISDDLYNFCEENEEAMAFLCSDCKLEIPSLREMKCIKAKQAKIETELSNIQRDAVETNRTIADLRETQTNLSETQTVQGQEITKHENDMKDVFNRLRALESAAPTEAIEDTEDESYASRVRNTKATAQIKIMVRSELSEQAEIEKIKMNLVISGMAETNNDESDKTNVMSLIDQELQLTADISKTERIGNPRIHKQGEDPPPPRLIKLHFITQRSRKEVLAKVTNLRKSTNEYIKKQVYIRPDLTKAQIIQSKNLRGILKTTRDENPAKVYKIFKNQVIEIKPTHIAPIVPTQQPETEQPVPEPHAAAAVSDQG